MIFTSTKGNYSKSLQEYNKSNDIIKQDGYYIYYFWKY